ncbi:MAG: class I SAM-dependent methyltransferase [Candidatus Omnitrophota bacterium]|nr:MAG: class I SAM-dependent methyltransferase [Candidatus Omnitrophota bacterium]
MEHKTYSFVKETKRDIYWRLRREEIEFLRDSTGKIKDVFAEPVNACLLCSSKERTSLFEREGFTFWRCGMCGFVYSDPQIKEESLVRLYRSSRSNDVWIDVLLSSANYSYDAKKYETGLKRIESLHPRGKILDIGCSIGHFLKIARDRGWDVLGLELNARAVQCAQEKWNLKIIEKNLSEAHFADASFDAVTLWGLIEHLKDPSGVMSQVRRILKPGGIVLVFCPNVESLVCRVLREKTSCFDGRNHCGYFSPTTMKYLFDRCEIDIVDIASFQPELDTILNHLNFSDPYIKDEETENSLRSILGPQATEALEGFILEKKIGYKMMILGRKR